MDTPSLFYEHEGSATDKVLIYIPGMITEDTLSLEEDKKNAILKAGWKGDIYYLWWDASNMKGLIVGSAIRLLPGAVTGGLVRGKFRKTQDAASKTGREYLPHFIRSLAPDKQVTFVAHSLGAHMLYELFKNPVDYPMHNPIEDVILLGGALNAKEKEWRQTSFRKLINVYNTNDNILKLLFPIGNLVSRNMQVVPCGMQAIGRDCVSEVVNINISNNIGSSHSRYYEVFSNGMLTYKRRNWVT